MQSLGGIIVNANPNRATNGRRVLVGGLSAVLLLAVLTARASAQVPAPLILKVITVSEASLYPNMTVVMGKSDAALIDVPFTRSDAHRVIADILETGKTLKYVYITHDHPDHFMSLEVLADAFPDAKLITAPTVVADIWRSLPSKLKRWRPMLGANGSRRPVVPVAGSSPHFSSRGRTYRSWARCREITYTIGPLNHREVPRYDSTGLVARILNSHYLVGTESG